MGALKLRYMYDASNPRAFIHTPSIQLDTQFCSISVEIWPSLGRILDNVIVYIGDFRVEKLDPVSICYTS